jgi:sugar phosphate isomerase/epimerase
MYGPYDFSDERNKKSWAAVTPALGFSGSGFFGRSASQVKSVMDRHGLKVPSLHTDIYTLQTGMGKLAEAAHTLGSTYVTLPSLPAEMRKNLDDYKRAADLFNKIGQDALRHGSALAITTTAMGSARSMAKFRCAPCSTPPIPNRFSLNWTSIGTLRAAAIPRNIWRVTRAATRWST